MKKCIYLIALMTIANTSFGQSQDRPLNTISHKNAWLKAGINAGLPIGDMGDLYKFSAGIEISGQFMRSNHFGVGVTSGYTHFFGDKSDPLFKVQDIGLVPLGLMLRYYPKSKGLFVGADLGYSFLTRGDVTGGFYVRPQIGYHNRDWNFYGFYSHTFINNSFIDIQGIGIAATYNIRFK